MTEKGKKKHINNNLNCPRNQIFDGEHGEVCVCGFEKDYYKEINKP